MNVDNENMQQKAMLMIARAGEGKGLAIEAIRLSKQGKLQEAKECLVKSEEALRQGHVANAELLWSEANGQNGPLSVLLVHAMDHIMNAMTVYDIANEIVGI